jgi:hypothetical protein
MISEIRKSGVSRVIVIFLGRREGMVDVVVEACDAPADLIGREFDPRYRWGACVMHDFNG